MVISLKKIILLLLIAVSCILYGEEENKKIYGEIIAKSGINIRSTPGTAGEARWTLPKGTIIEIKDKNGPKDVIGGKEGVWYKIKYGDEEFWVFGFYVKEKENINDIVVNYDSGIKDNRSIFLRIYSYGKYLFTENRRGTDNYITDIIDGKAEYIKEKNGYKLYFAKDISIYSKLNEYFKNFDINEGTLFIDGEIDRITVNGVECVDIK